MSDSGFPPIPERQSPPSFDLPQWVVLNASGLAIRYYALCLGASSYRTSLPLQRITELLGCTKEEARDAYNELLDIGAFSIAEESRKVLINRLPPDVFSRPWILHHVVPEFAAEIAEPQCLDYECGYCHWNDRTLSSCITRDPDYHTNRRQQSVLAAARVQPKPRPADNRPQVLYRFFNEEDELLYVGITNDLTNRMKSHNRQKPWWKEVVRTTLEHFDSRQQVESAERNAILREKPKYNIDGNPSISQGAASKKSFDFSFSGKEDIRTDGTMSYGKNSKGKPRLRIEGTQTVIINGQEISLSEYHFQTLQGYNVLAWKGGLNITKIRS